MFTIRVRADFSSAHNLRGYEGKCEELHGHNWHVEVSAAAEELDDTGMVADFNTLKKELKAVLSGLDHKYLNDIDHFKQHNPTSENIARYVYDKLAGRKPGLRIGEVTVWETDTSSATYGLHGQAGYPDRE